VAGTCNKIAAFEGDKLGQFEEKIVIARTPGLSVDSERLPLTARAMGGSDSAPASTGRRRAQTIPPNSRSEG
jgi:hypothetical protein